VTSDDRSAVARRRARWIAFLVVLAAVAATVIQTGWMEGVKAHLSSTQGSTRTAVPLRLLLQAARKTVDVPAALAAAAALFAFLEIVRVCWRQARDPASGGLAALLPRGAIGLWLLGLPAAWTFVRWHFAPGVMAGFDVDLHVSTVALAAQEISEGRWPRWTDAWYLGFPILQHYGAAYYLPAAALAALVGDVRFGAKAVVALWHLAAAPGAYLLARECGASRGAAFVAAIAYVACPYFGVTLALVGSLTAAPVIALTPLALFFAIRTARGTNGLGSAAGWGLTLASLAWAHPGYALQVAALSVAAAAVAGGRGVLTRGFAIRGATALALAVLAALPLLVENLVEGLPQEGAAPGVAYFLRPGVPDAGLLASSLRWSVTWKTPPAGYLGAAFVALGLVGLWLLARRGPLRAWAVVPLVVLLWTGGGFYQARALLLLPATLLPGLARALSATAARAPAYAVLLGAVLAIDAAAGNLFSPYRRDLEDFQSALHEEARTQGRGRTILLSRDDRGVLSAGEWQVGYEAPLRTLTGGFREAAPPAYRKHLDLLDRTARDPTLEEEGLAEELASYEVVSIRVLDRRRLLPADPIPARRLAAARERTGPPDKDYMGSSIVMRTPWYRTPIGRLAGPALAVFAAFAIRRRRLRSSPAAPSTP
jgi:hypothetical protein